MSKELCEEEFGGVWANHTPWHFDNVGSALATVFSIATLDGWADIMQVTVDSDGRDRPPIRDNRMWPALYFVVVIVVCGFFAFSLFVGVITNKFRELKKE